MKFAKKALSLLFAAMMLFTITAGIKLSAFAATATVNSKNVTIYTLDSGYAKQISIPSDLNKEFQLKVSGASTVSYSVVSGERYISVSSSGLIKPVATTWYNNGNYWSTWPPSDAADVETRIEYENGDAVVRVKADSTTIDVKVHSVDYANYYANQVMDNYINNNVKSSMSDYERVCLAAKFAADYEYSANYSSATSMIIYGGGDCWASTDAIIKLCTKMGFDAWSRNGNKDPGAGSGHMNAMVQVSDGTYYEVEAGFYEPAPRGYWVTERDSLFSVKYLNEGVEIYQYDGKTIPEKFVIPEKIGNSTVVSIGEKFINLNSTVKTITLPETVKTIKDSAFNSCAKLESINLPKALEELGSFAFTACLSLKTIENSSPNFEVSDGVIYNKGKTELLYAPAVTSLVIPSTVKTIGYYSIRSNSNLKSVTIPDSVALIKEGAFGDCSNLGNVAINGNSLKQIDDFAFANCTGLSNIVLPISVSEIGDYAFYNIENSITLYGYAGTASETYSKNKNVSFVDLSKGCPHLYENGKITKAATCTVNGTKTYTCTICKATKTETIKATGHSYDNGTVTKKATCTAAGVKTYTCKKCEETKTETVAKTAHTYKTSTTKATTSKNGSIVTKCTVCGNQKSKTTIYYPKTITLSKTSYVYNGKAQKPSVTVKDSKGKKIAASNYTVTYASGRKNVGTYTVTIKFKGNYSGTVTKTFTIKPKSTTLSSVTAKSKGFTAKWKKQATQTTGYEIQYSTDKNFKKNNKTVTVSKNSTTSKAVSKLTAKKKYYVRIRTYKTVKVNGKSTKIYSSWSKSKFVTTKK